MHGGPRSKKVFGRFAGALDRVSGKTPRVLPPWPSVHPTFFSVLEVYLRSIGRTRSSGSTNKRPRAILWFDLRPCSARSRQEPRGREAFALLACQHLAQS